jgi:hypothetical protein
MRTPFVSLALVTLFASTALAASDMGDQHHDMHHQGHDMMMRNHAPATETTKATPAQTLKAEIISPATLQIGKPNSITLRLTRTTDAAPVTLADLQEVHTRKLHLLIIDPTLTDYHHVHPEPTATPGVYRFTFIPNQSAYRVWADVLPTASGKQEYVITDLGKSEGTAAKPAATLNTTQQVGGYTFQLTLDGPLQVGKATMAKVTVTDSKGQPVRTLEPVMGAFGHIVGFSENFQSVAHIHPMGAEPKTETARGGPVLDLHIEPQAPGYLKLFVQTRINGKDLFAPFGVTVTAR